MTKRSQSFLTRLIRDPVVHFFVLGALINAAYFATATPDVEENPNKITVTTGEVEWLATAFSKRWGRAPTQQELAGLIDAQVRETVLYRQAIDMGLDQDDVVIRRRLAQKLEFLVQDLQQIPAPIEEELMEFYKANSERYAGEPTITFTQVFFDPDKRNETTLDDAEAAKSRLISGQFNGAPSELGDEFLLDNRVEKFSRLQVAKMFGSGFSGPVFDLEAGLWHGPVLSGYGTHLVFVEEVYEPAVPPLESVREQVIADWSDAKREETNAAFFERLIEGYDIVVEDAPNVEVILHSGGGT